jgi:hypothetical protein
VAVTVTNSPGRRYLILGFGLPSLEALFLGSLLIIVAWVMVKAITIDDEKTYPIRGNIMATIVTIHLMRAQRTMTSRKPIYSSKEKCTSHTLFNAEHCVHVLGLSHRQ